MATREDHLAAVELAEETGRALLKARDEMAAKGYGPALVMDTGDQLAHEHLVAAITERFPGDSILSEEATAAERRNSNRLTAQRVWIVDPIDGTREFGTGRSDWAVHVALVEDGIPTAAAVALPARGLTLGTLEPLVPPPPALPRRLVVSRSRPAPEAYMLAEVLETELIPMGSAGAKAMSVVLGESDIYVHSGGQFEWDSAAPIGVATASGLWCSRIDGSPFAYNRLDTYLPDLLICHTEDAERILEILN